MIKFLFDRIVALIGIIILLPLLFIIAIWVMFDSKGGAFFVQTRVGKDGQHFGLLKFRTMRPLSEKRGKLTVGSNDPRITRSGLILRKYKIDELPQLFNVLVADMSFVGPRPEVPDYVAFYNARQRKVLNVRPGITDEASLAYFNENELLSKSENPQKTYLEEIMPAKIELNLAYLKRRTFLSDIGIILRTLGRIVS
ncbi:sugar transferase [Cryomorphaceae bacterium 1068]|nr:sugar transferase [Cryomorphaceae bacterium 1068]